MVTMRYTYLGPSGTFTESALLSVPGASDAERIPATSVPDALARLNAGEADAAMVPIENSVEGGVSATLDAIAASEGVRIIREAVSYTHLSGLTYPSPSARQSSSATPTPRCASSTSSMRQAPHR